MFFNIFRNYACGKQILTDIKYMCVKSRQIEVRRRIKDDEIWKLSFFFGEGRWMIEKYAKYAWLDFHEFVESKNREKIKLELEVF